MPRLGDTSQAIIGRLILIPVTVSWLGREDHSLEGEPRMELTGILNWALDGLTRLTANRGRFTRVPSADEAIRTLRDLASPVAAFVREECVVGHGRSVKRDRLYSAYRTWADNGGYPKSPKHVFGRDLRAANTKIMTLGADEFICRFLQHTVPSGFHRIRYFGFLANGHRAAKLALCRRLLAIPSRPSRPRDVDYRERYRQLTGISLDICPDCGGWMHEIGLIPKQPRHAKPPPLFRCDTS